MKKKAIQSCLKTLKEFKSGPFLMVIFGGSGDLSKKKLLPTIYNLYKKKFIKDFIILPIGSTKRSKKEYISFLETWLKKFLKKDFDEKIFSLFKKSFHYHTLNLTKEESYIDLCQSIKKYLKQLNTQNLIYYLALPTNIVPTVVRSLSKNHLCKEKKEAKIVIEKPFGEDKKTAHLLNQDLLKAFEEDQIYRIDHYLGKESVQNIFFFRFSNIFEPLWNKNYIDHVQITVAEDVGIEERGNFYDKVGVIKDIVQNHLMQLIALIAMEPPLSFDSELLRKERIKVLKSIKIFKKNEIEKYTLAGQYEKGVINKKKVLGYLEEKDIPKNSTTPTYFAAKFFVENSRWKGIPFYVRSGKRLKKRFTEIAITFKYPPLKLLGHACSNIEANTLIFNIYPHQKISLLFNVKFPGMENIPYPVNMDFDYQKEFKIDPPLAYERLLIDILKSDITLFAEKEGIEAMWNIVDPIVSFYKKKKNILKYPSGSFGPKEANDLLKKDQRSWR